MDKSKLKLTAEDRVKEYLKCKNSFLHFCSNYIYIEQPGGDVLLTPYEPQRKLIDTIGIHNYVLVLKSRQIGISTIIQAYCAWLSVFYENVVIGIISKDAPEATDFARFVRGMVEKLPKWMSPNFSKCTEQSFILKNGSKVYASPVNPNAPEKCLRGKAITFLVIDEAAFVKFIDEAWTSMVPALSTNQKAARKYNVPHGTIVLSTPNKTVGVGKWFYERYMNAVSGNDIFKDFVIHWKDVKELAEDSEWYDTQCKLFDNDKRKIEQELELKFLATGGSFFEEHTVQVLQDIQVEPIEKIKLFNGEAWRYARAIPGAYYLIGVDTAPEHGEDKSAITVWDYRTLEQVFEYQGKLSVTNFTRVVEVTAAQYPGLIVVESNSYGNQVVEYLNNSELATRLYKEKRGQNTLVPGLSTTSKTRPLIIDSLYTYITQHPECVKSKRMILELIGLVTKNSGRVEADTGCHDDLCLSAGLCFYVHKWDPPLMIDSSRYNGLTKDMADIISMNNDVAYSNHPHDLLNQVKQAMDENNNSQKDFSYVDVLSFYNKS